MNKDEETAKRIVDTYSPNSPFSQKRGLEAAISAALAERDALSEQRYQDALKWRRKFEQATDEIAQWREGVLSIIDAMGGTRPEIISFTAVCEVAAQLRAEVENWQARFNAMEGFWNDTKAKLAEAEATRDRYERDAIFHRVKVEDLKDERDAALRGYTATGVESWPCPGCKYENGVFVEPCGLHEQVAAAERQRDDARVRLENQMKAARARVHHWDAPVVDLESTLKKEF